MTAPSTLEHLPLITSPAGDRIESCACTNTYVKEENGTKKILEAGKLGSDLGSTPDKEVGVIWANERMYSKTVRTNQSLTFTTELGLLYPDGAMANSFVIKDCIIEYRTTLGSERTSSTADGSTFGKTYGVNEIVVGIPSAIFRYIETGIRKITTRGSAVESPISLANSKYDWQDRKGTNGRR